MKIEEVCKRLGWDCPSNIDNYPGSLLARIMSIVEELDKSVDTYYELALLNSNRVELLEKQNLNLINLNRKLQEELAEAYTQLEKKE
jgi:hypothetical protein